MEATTRKKALDLGLSKYFTGKICKNGHIDYRYANCGGCIQCKKSDKYKKLNKEYQKLDKYKEGQKRYRQSSEGKKSKKKSELKLRNARKSVNFYTHNKHKIKVLDNCEQCNSVNHIEAHHHDYNLPLDVTYLCRPCHLEWHKNNTPLNRISGIFTTKEK